MYSAGAGIRPTFSDQRQAQLDQAADGSEFGAQYRLLAKAANAGGGTFYRDNVLDVFHRSREIIREFCRPCQRVDAAI